MHIIIIFLKWNAVLHSIMVSLRKNDAIYLARAREFRFLDAKAISQREPVYAGYRRLFSLLTGIYQC